MVKIFKADNFENFYLISSVVLGLITGVLITIPIATQTTTALYGTFLLITGALIGAFIGYRRASQAFIYLCFVAILILSGVITSSL